MKFKDIKIQTQLRFGLGLILAFVLLLGGLAWRQANLLFLQTQLMYDHPLQVRRAVGKLEEDSQALSHYVRDLLLAETDDEIMKALETIELFEIDIERQFDTLYDGYLGPSGDIISLQDAFGLWNAIRDESIRLYQDGQTAEAATRHTPGGTGDIQAAEVRNYLLAIDNFAKDKADQLQNDANILKNNLIIQMAVILAAILLLSISISFILINGISGPLKQITSASENFRTGNQYARSKYFSANEFGELSKSFDALADTIQADVQIRESAANFNLVLAGETELRTFCRNMLGTLIEQTGSQIGAVYFLNAQKNQFEYFESIGLSAEGRRSFSVQAREGEFGAALLSGQLERITDIPEDTNFTFNAVSGNFNPQEIITIPLLSNDEVTAMVSLASIRAYGPNTIRLLEDVLSPLTARMIGVQAYQRIQEQAEQLELLSREQEAQSKELAAQANELTEQNTELEMQKKELGEANQLKSTFLSNMSHELRTPLNSVIALSGVLNRRLAKTIPAEEYSYLDVIERNGKQLLGLINDILDLSRIEAGQDELDLKSLSIRALVSEIVDTVEFQAKEKDIALLNQVSEGLPFITSDPDKCHHILQNLIGNAVKFTEIGSVEISAQHVDDEIYVEVKDSGIGIIADQLPHIFEEFRQVDDSASRKYGGTGLGLSIARKYAAMLQGFITVESEPGKGSTFTLRLPLEISPPGINAVERMESRDAGVGIRSALATAGLGKLILLVEDSEPAVIQITDMLSIQGYQVKVAHNGIEALAQIEDALPEAMILDLMMPEMDGFEVLKTIRDNERSALLPVLILTARHVTKKELSFLKENNIHQLIQKGDISKNELLVAIEQMVAPPSVKKVEPESKTIRTSNLDKPLILVVEDNPDNLLTIRALLQDSCTLLEATDGQAGIENAREHGPDLILMDLALPVMDGYEALLAIREDDKLRQIPVVAVTASAMKGSREKILAYGFDGYISKPIDEELLRKIIQELLYGR